jgi:DNA-binding HxlR family transcriptional regulator
MEMARRSYNQACGIARFLDVLGERWTLLIMREILFREPRGEPKRFGEILERLPGISRNLLTTRLRHLESAGFVERAEPVVGGRTMGWTATARGKELSPVLMEIGNWGERNLPEPSAVGASELESE